MTPFRILGTPDETTWPGVKSLQDWNESFPTWPALSMKKVIPNASEDAIDLIERLLIHDPRHRISAKDALEHPYIAGL